MASKRRRQAVALWAYLVAGDLSTDDPEPFVELGQPVPLHRVRELVQLWADVGSRQATNPYLEQMELLDLATWHRGNGHQGDGRTDPGFVVFHNPDGPIPYLRPPSVVRGNEDPVFTLDDPNPDTRAREPIAAQP